MTNEDIAIEQWLAKPEPYPNACCCVGTRDGEPLCPCGMKWVEIVYGRFYQIYEERSQDGVSRWAEEIFVPPTPKLEERCVANLTLKERLQEKYGKRCGNG